MINNYVNPYLNQYAQYPNYQQQIQQQLPQQQVVKVNGENGAKAFSMGANSSALLLDECGTIVWLKCTDGAGYATVTPYDIAPHKIAPTQEYVTLESRITKLEETLNEYTASTNTQSVKSKKSNVTDNANG